MPPAAHKIPGRGVVAFNGERYVALFNLGDRAETESLMWNEIGITSPVTQVRNLWLHKPIEAQSGIHIELGSHASAMYRVTLAQ